MRAPGTTVWPNDVVEDVRELERASPHRLVCFLLSPFDPPDVFDPVHDAVRVACNLCAHSAGVEIECRRADTLHEAKPIHDDIWRHIAAADLLVVDVTGLNPNVMIEFGVAAALRRPAQVILIKSAEDTSRLPFNAFAQRYVTYRKSIVGDQQFIAGLQAAMIQAITPAPYVPPRQNVVTVAPVHVDFQDGDRPDLILSPAVTHRRCVGDCLEYGSFFVFRNSWLLLTGADYGNVRVKALFRFSSLAKDPSSAFFGVSLRNHHFLANWGHLIYLRADGVVIRTEPRSDLGEYRDVEEGRIAGFDHRASNLLELEAEFTDHRLVFKIGNIERELKIVDMPYVYGAGKVRLCTFQCRVLLRKVECTAL